MTSVSPSVIGSEMWDECLDMVAQGDAEFKAFLQTAAGAIAHHSMSQLGGHGKSQPVARTAVGPHINGKSAVCSGLSFVVKPAEQVIFL